MLGIWTLPVNLSGSSFTDSSALSQIVFAFVFLAAIVVAWFRLPGKNESVGAAFNNIRYALNFLLMWYIVTILDLFLHEGMLHAAYGYILLYFFIAVLRYTADILLLGGAHRIISCRLYIQLNKPLSWILVGEIQILILVLLALYYVGSYVANEVLWLNVADPEIVDDLSNRKDKFEAAFFIIQFIFALFVFVGSLISAWKWRKYDKHIPKPAYFAIAATATLWARSVSELFVVIHYHLQQNPGGGSVDAARDFIYGLGTAAFLFLINTVARDRSCQEPQDALSQMIQGDCHRYIINIIQDADEGKRPLPVLAAVFQAMRQNPAVALTNSTIQAMGQNNGLVLDYIGTLERNYGMVRPVDQAREY